MPTSVQITSQTSQTKRFKTNSDNPDTSHQSQIDKDLKRYGINKIGLFKAWLTGHTIMVVLRYRFANWFVRHGIRMIPEMIMARTRHVFGCEISPHATIGGGVFLPHSLGIVIGNSVKIGDDFEVFQNVTIGSNRKVKDGQTMPIIGNNVSIGTGSVVVGPITIGNNVVIGANSYVDKDLPDNSFVIGAPARIIKRVSE